MKRFILTAIFILITVVSFSQNCYNLNRGNGIKAFNNKRYTEAKAHFQQATKCPDRPKNNDIQSWIGKCNAKINESKIKPNNVDIERPSVKKTDTYIRVDGKSFTSSSRSASSSSEYFNVSTDAHSWSTWGIPSWCYITEKSSSGFRLNYRENNSTSARSDYMEVRTPKGHSARINISQSGKTTNKSANIDNVYVENDVDVDGSKGLAVHVNFSINDMKGKDGKVSCYFYDSDGNALIDKNGAGKYGTNGTTSHVASSENIKPGYDNSRYPDLVVKIPYEELHLSGSYSRTLRVDVLIWDYSSSNHNTLTRKDGTTFTCTPNISYLKVDNSTTDKTKHFGENGGREFYAVNASTSYETWGVPSWCSIEGKTSSGFTLVCSKNRTTSARSDYMKVKAAGKEVRIDIRQDAGTGPSANVTSVTQEHNVMNGFVKGMNIKLKFETSGMKNRNVTATAWFYYGDNTTKLNNGYGGQVNVSRTDLAPYDETTFTMTLFLPYASLNMGRGWSGALSFDIVIKDSSGNVLVRNENNTFTYTNGF